MTSIHAPIPLDLRTAVQEARSRGEDSSSFSRTKEDEIQYQRPRKQQRIHRGTPKKTARRTSPNTHLPQAAQDANDARQSISEDDNLGDSENDDPVSASKENNPSLSPTPIRLAPSQRKNALGKRPLSILAMPYPEDPDTEMMLVDSDPDPGPGISPASNTSEQNIIANTPQPRKSVSPQRKTPKLPLRKGIHAPSRLRDDLQIYEDVPDRTRSDWSRHLNSDGNETRNLGIAAPNEKDRRHLPEINDHYGHNSVASGSAQIVSPARPQYSSRVPKKVIGGSRKPGAPRPKPRIGVRRL